MCFFFSLEWNLAKWVKNPHSNLVKLWIDLLSNAMNQSSQGLDPQMWDTSQH